MAIKTVRIGVTPPKLPENEVWISCSVEISTDPKFITGMEVREHKLVPQPEYVYLINMQENQGFYVRTKIHCERTDNIDGVDIISEVEYGWSRTSTFNSNLNSILLSSSVISTPIVRHTIDYTDNTDGILIISTSEFDMHSGIGNIKSTSWQVTDSDGSVVYSRPKDEDNLYELRLEYSILKPDKCYCLTAQHNTDTISSNIGKDIIFTTNGSIGLFDVEYDDTCIPAVNKWLWFKLNVYATGYEHCDIDIRDKNNNIVVSNNNQITITPKIPTNLLIVGERYNVFVRIKLTNGYTGYKQVYSFIAQPNFYIKYNDSANYSDEYTFIKEHMTGGIVKQSIRQLCNGDIITCKNNESALYRSIRLGTNIIEMSKIFDLEKNEKDIGTPYLNVWPTVNGLLLIDIASNIENSFYWRPRFILGEYNPINNKLQRISEVTRDDELYGTSLSCSLVPMHNNRAYYIPASITINGVDLEPLTLRAVNYSSNIPVIEDVSDLPFTAHQFVSVLAIDNDTLLVFGGANTMNISNYDELWTRTNNKVYTYTLSSGLWNHIADIPNKYSINIYNMQGMLRVDKKVVIFNATDNINTRGDQSTLIFDISTRTFNLKNNDHGDQLAYMSNIYMQNGDMYRISGREIDPQKIYGLYSRPLLEEEKTDNTIIDTVKDLVVPVGKTITIESPYRYRTIHIEGTSVTNTGILKYTEDGVTRTFIYSDLIITRPTVLWQDLYRKSYDPEYMRWTSVNIFGNTVGVWLTIKNMVILPNNTIFNLSLPVVLDKVEIGENSQLILTDPHGNTSTLTSANNTNM